MCSSEHCLSCFVFIVSVAFRAVRSECRSIEKPRVCVCHVEWGIAIGPAKQNCCLSWHRSKSQRSGVVAAHWVHHFSLFFVVNTLRHNSAFGAGLAGHQRTWKPNQLSFAFARSIVVGYGTLVRVCANLSHPIRLAAIIAGHAKILRIVPALQAVGEPHCITR